MMMIYVYVGVNGRRAVRQARSVSIVAENWIRNADLENNNPEESFEAGCCLNTHTHTIPIISSSQGGKSTRRRILEKLWEYSRWSAEQISRKGDGAVQRRGRTIGQEIHLKLS